ncbi:tetratricopeptide repeat protein [Mongoliimonas terrestris]|uniref:tetratricopeptide repeat protein n=1 Tax=Mongoliimonas terrestris TaxID=1709001 RepID=UPI0009495908|nr:tetratricopeptide repeat protein [Mongoliimonas terrestris]
MTRRLRHAVIAGAVAMAATLGPGGIHAEGAGPETHAPQPGSDPDARSVRTLSLGRDSVSIDEAAAPDVEPFLPPPTDFDPTLELPNADTVDYAYGAFQRGLYLTSLAIALEHATDGDATAQTLVGFIYANGYGVPKNPKEAAIWYDLAAKAGDAGAMMELANLYALGVGVARDQARARTLLEAALAKGRKEAAYGLGLLYLDPENDEADLAKAARVFETAAAAGNADADYALATMFAEGRGVVRDASEAARRMSRAARGGHMGAQVEYAIMLFNGNGVEKDERTAAAWFRLAAQAGNPVAQNRLARLYAAGLGVPLNLAEAARWHRKARAAGISDLWLDGMVGGSAPPSAAGVPTATAPAEPDTAKN